MNKRSTRKLVLSGLFIALGVILPYFTGRIGELGRALLPMHIPVLIAGFVCGGPYGLVVGFVTPILNSVISGMPPMFPYAVVMSFELAAYGLMTGLLYKLLPKKDLFVYPALLLSMIVGRIVWGIASLFFLGLQGNAFTWQAFIGGAFLNAIPGIIIQIIIIPIIIIALKRAGFIENER
ncbi:MAG: ECF transporter S component [Clostridiales bacterium]|nr:ECF transporter S component [Clostridiales bacterium]